MDVHDNIGVQVGDGNQLHIHAVDNDVGLLVTHGSEQISPDHDNPFHLLINNRTSAPKRLEIKVEGVGDSVAEVVPERTVDLPGGGDAERTLVLRCGATEPTAGPLSFRVVVNDRDTGRFRVQSEQVRITIPAKPALTSTLVLGSRVSSAGPHTASLWLVNNGNVGLRGRLRVHNPFEGVVDVLPKKAVRLRGDRFYLKPGERTEIAVELDFPSQEWADRTWTVPVTVEVAEYETVGGVLSSGGEITQYGLSSDLRRTVADLTRRFRKWSGSVHPVRGRRLLGYGSVLLFGGFLLGLVFAPPPAESAAPPPTTRPAPAPSASVTEVPYTAMPCQPDTSVAMLMPLTADEARAHGAWLLEVETERLGNWAEITPVLNNYAVHASMRAQLCPTVVGHYGPKYTTFIWVGPVPTTEAATLCEDLNRPADKDDNDCLLLPTT